MRGFPTGLLHPTHRPRLAVTRSLIHPFFSPPSHPPLSDLSRHLWPLFLPPFPSCFFVAVCMCVCCSPPSPSSSPLSPCWSWWRLLSLTRCSLLFPFLYCGVHSFSLRGLPSCVSLLSRVSHRRSRSLPPSSPQTGTRMSAVPPSRLPPSPHRRTHRSCFRVSIPCSHTCPSFSPVLLFLCDAAITTTTTTATAAATAAAVMIMGRGTYAKRQREKQNPWWRRRDSNKGEVVGQEACVCMHVGIHSCSLLSLSLYGTLFLFTFICVVPQSCVHIHLCVCA